MADFEVLIIGAGLGGLTLAQSLRSAGVAFKLFGRDTGPFERSQGYRLHLDADLDRATLRHILLADLAFQHGKMIDHYVSSAHGVDVTFTDGITAQGDVLLGADGIRSAVRGHCQVVFIWPNTTGPKPLRRSSRRHSRSRG